MISGDGRTGTFVSQFPWDDFFRSNWRKRPAVIRNAFTNPDETLQHCYDLLRNVSQLYCHRSPEASLEVFPSGRLQFVDVEPYLPRRDEELYSRYIARVVKEPGGDFLTIVLYNCQTHSEEIFFGAKQFLQPLINYEGLTNHTVDVDLFVGAYEYTPSGIHFDVATNFSFVLGGQKRMMFWPQEAFGQAERLASRGGMMLASADVTLRNRDYDLLEARPGDIIYWPSGYWHMATSAGWCTTLNVALYSESMPGRSIVSALSSVDVGEMIEAAPLPVELNERAEIMLPNRIVGFLNDFKQKIQSVALEDELLIRWLKRVSASGFDLVLPMRDNSVVDTWSHIIPRKDSPVYIARASSGALFIAANGHMITCEDAQRVRNVVQTINCGTVCSASDIAARSLPDDDWKERDLTAFLGLLYQMRAIDVGD